MKINIFLLPVLLMLGSSSGRVNVSADIRKFVVDHCNIKPTFVVLIIGNAHLRHTLSFSHYACSGALVKTNLVLTTISCYDINGGSLVFEKMEKPQKITVMAGFEEKYLVETFVFWAWDIRTEDYRKRDGFIILRLAQHFRPSRMVSTIKLAPEGKADKCKHAQLVSAVVLENSDLREPGMKLAKTVDVHVLCSPVKVIDESVCTSLWPWIPPTYSWCGETKPTGRMDKFHLETDSLVCEQAFGSPLVCDGVVVGFQGTCLRSNDVTTSFIKIDSYLDLIDFVFLANSRSLKGKNKTTTAMRASNAFCLFLISILLKVQKFYVTVF